MVFQVLKSWGLFRFLKTVFSVFNNFAAQKKVVIKDGRACVWGCRLLWHLAVGSAYTMHKLGTVTNCCERVRYFMQ